MLSVALMASMLLGDFPATQLTDGVKLTSLSGCNNTAINVATNCEFRAIFGGANQYLTTHNYHVISVFIYFDQSGATGYTFSLQGCIEGFDATDCTDSTDWYYIDAQTATAHYTDLEPKIYRRTVSADDRSVFLVATVFPRMRVAGLICTGGGCTANDKVSVTAILHTDSMGFLP
jgi:hypothetical protein